MTNINDNPPKKYKVKNAIIMAAGISSRFAPLSYEFPKALLVIKGEVLIERQIRQLKEAGIDDITLVVGYKKELFYYLKDKYGVSIIENPEYQSRNNNSTLYYAKSLLGNTFVCSADNYFEQNVFEPDVVDSYYAAVFQTGPTNEWCIKTDETGLMTDVVIGGENSWVMLGHAFFSEEFAKRFVAILERIYEDQEVKPLLWESIYLKYINQLPMFIRKYSKEMIFEFDTLDELRAFDESYWDFTRSKIIQQVAEELGCRERDITEAKPIGQNGQVIGFSFKVNDELYRYSYSDNAIKTGED